MAPGGDHGEDATEREMKYATVKLGEYTVPLLGIPETASQEVCRLCKKPRHLTEVHLTAKDLSAWVVVRIAQRKADQERN